MKGYEGIRDRLDREEVRDKSLDAAQLVKHALALRTQVNRGGAHEGLTPILFYVYAEPEVWPTNCMPVDEGAIDGHRMTDRGVRGRLSAETRMGFVYCPYRRLLEGWQESGAPHVRTHAEAVLRCFAP